MDQRILIAQLNIEHYRRQLASEQHDERRRTISRLLVVEEAKLAAFNSAEQKLKQILDNAARQAKELFDRERPEQDRHECEVRLAATLDQTPFAIGLTDHTGNWITANGAMRRLAPRQALACDQERAQRCRGFDSEGHPLPPTHWPSARALRGQAVNPGIEFIYTTDEGQQVRFRIAAVPVRYGNGNIAGAIVVAEELEMPLIDKAC